MPAQPTFACDPRRMAAIAALCGAKPPSTAGTSVVDVSSLVAADLAAITDGSADFVSAHHVITKVDEGARASFIAEAARITRKGGLVVLSYDASPGALRRIFTRSIGRRAAKAAIQVGDAASAHDEVVARLNEAARTILAGSDFAALAASEAERVAGTAPDDLLASELSEHWEPLAVTEVAATAAQHGLSYIGELQPSDRWRERLTTLDISNVTKLAGAGRAAQQQLVDDMLGAEFHASLFIRGAAPREPIGGGPRRPAGPPAAQWHASTRYVGEWPQLKAEWDSVAGALRAAGPGGVAIGEIAQRIGQTPDAVRQTVSVLDAHALARLDLSPAPAAT